MSKPYSRTIAVWAFRLVVYFYVACLLLAPALIAYPFVGWEWSLLIFIATVGAARLLLFIAVRKFAALMADMIKAEVEAAAADLPEEVDDG